MTYFDVVTEALYWLRVTFVVGLVMLVGLYLIMGLGYFSQKVSDQRELACVNAACEKPCNGQKLKRHEGCVRP